MQRYLTPSHAGATPAATAASARHCICIAHDVGCSRVQYAVRHYAGPGRIKPSLTSPVRIVKLPGNNLDRYRCTTRAQSGGDAGRSLLGGLGLSKLTPVVTESDGYTQSLRDIWTQHKLGQALVCASCTCVCVRARRACPCVCAAVGIRGVRVEAGEGATCGGCYGDTVAVAALPIPWHTEDEAAVVAAASRSRPARWGGWVAVPVDEGLGGPRQPSAGQGPRPGRGRAGRR